MEKIIWWWNMVYYFCVKWYAKVGDIVTCPLYKLFNTSVLRKWSYKKRGVEYDEKIVKDAVKQAQIAETYTEILLSIFLTMPFAGFSWIINGLFDSNGIVKGVTIFTIGLSASAIIVFFPIQDYLLGKNDRYKKYFKEFDKMFKKEKAQKRLYEILCLFTIVSLIVLCVLEFYIGNHIMHLTK